MLCSFSSRKESRAFDAFGKRLCLNTMALSTFAVSG